MMVRRVLWVLLCLIAGGPCAFLALEGIGTPIITAVLVLVALVFIAVGMRRHVLTEALTAFGSTYSIVIVGFALPNFVLAAQHNDVGAAAYFAGHLAVAGAIVLSGCAGYC